ncbi:adenosine receptor A1-like [Physella acuta]|uniref:adenosine receptor A1-like n=1 Tax=Physella acuta TaxID=109671 RepID=UPI0027DC0086|nr:adenosine receptor A1-like [Physella acuta]
MVFIVAAIIFIPLAVVGNLLVFFGILLYPGFYNNSNVILMAIAVFDFFMGAECLPMYIMCYVSPTKYIIANNRHLCVLKLVSPLISYAGSLYCLMLLSVDRYLAIMFPFRYHIWITYRRCVYITMTVICFIFSTAALPLMGWNNYNPAITDHHKKCYFYGTLPRFLLTYMFFIPNNAAIVISIVVNFHIGIVVFRQMRSFKVESILWTHEQKRNFSARMSSVKITLALMCLFILFTAPYLSVLPFKMFKVFPENTVEAIKMYTLIPLFGNSIVNGCVYAVMKTEYRQVYLTMLATYPWNWQRNLRGLYRLNNTSFATATSQHTEMTAALKEYEDEVIFDGNEQKSEAGSKVRHSSFSGVDGVSSSVDKADSHGKSFRVSSIILTPFKNKHSHGSPEEKPASFDHLQIKPGISDT